jgi:hypothetical protein
MPAGRGMNHFHGASDRDLRRMLAGLEIPAH